MSQPGHRWANIRRTIQTEIGNSIAYAGSDVPIFHDYYSADPDDLSSIDSRKPAWVETRFINQLAGRRGFALLQLDVFSQVSSHNGDDGDQFGFRADGISDAIADLFSGVRPSGVQRGKVFIKDYESDINNPTITKMCLFMQSSVGNIGELEDRRRLDFAQDFHRVTLRMRFRTIQDAAGNAAFYT